MIENNFLVENKNGTSFIKEGADKYIDQITLNQITTGINSDSIAFFLGDPS
ncbi:hypothetical protein [Desulfosporosinus lacus]|uniref:Uncharacterized protein n=1 Tax=Desulfosporosinus lacus DSM 15449 TaxID=1121420 RepID=A0A1M6A5I7_9FIRM|nr:hypothetical protein [Desulfosporosinus lacus]SHI31710.1 hypothetical protein SAMN02746098_03899 [Desulfosporosinus lacus DSM 15449]